MDTAARLREQKYQRAVTTPAMEFFLSAWWRIGLPLMRDGKVVRLLVGMERAPRQPDH